jgi:hypothetical protein
MSNLATIRGEVRVDLHDEDAGAYRWTDATLNRHIERAVLEYSLVSPLEKKSTIAVTEDTRDVSLATLATRLRVVAAEYPTGEYPPSYVPFVVWAETLTLDLVSAPSGTPNVNVYWHGPHTINGTVSFPSSHDDIIAGGAGAFAALEWASYATNRLNAGEATWGKYMDFGQVRLAAFRAALRDLPAAQTLRTGRLYTPQTVRFRSQTTDPGPV